MFNLTPSRRGQRAVTTTHRGHPLDLLRHEFESMFERMFGRWPAFTEMSDEMEAMRFWDLTTTENDSEFVVKAEVPGFDANELNVQLNDNLLTIEAEKRKEGEQEKEFSRFRRSVTLPSGIDAEKAQASYRNGVLELHFPKTEQAKSRRIPVEGASTSTLAAEKELQGSQQQAAGQDKASAKKS